MENLVFIGDSVTDCDYVALPPFGFGYVSEIAKKYSDRFNIINTGTSGNRLVDLDARWQRDVLENDPQILSIAIGINDTWRRYDGGGLTPRADFETRYRKLLESVRTTLNPKIVLCEPFLLPVRDEMKSWREDLDPKIEVVHLLSIEFGATLVPFDQMFAATAITRSIPALTEDGIHPTFEGHKMMAELWIEKVFGQPTI